MSRFNITEVPLANVPAARGAKDWPPMLERALTATAAGNAIVVTPMTDGEATNFAQHARKKGYSIRRRRSGEGFVIWVERNA